MMENYQHRSSLPTLPPPEIVVHTRMTPMHFNNERNDTKINTHADQVRKILRVLSQENRVSRRQQNLERALSLFSHNNIEFHDVEMNLGVDKILCLEFGYAVVAGQGVGVSKEFSLFCQCFQKILRCSSINRLRSFRHVGATELLPLLIKIWIKNTKNKCNEEYQSLEFNDGLVSIVRVFRAFSKVIPAKSYFINYSKGVFAGFLFREVLIWLKEPRLFIDSSNEMIWETLGLVKDLTFRSQANDKQLLLKLDGEVFCDIISASFKKIEEYHQRFQEWCTAIIWNLVLDPLICRSLLNQSTTNNVLLGTIIVEGLLQILIQYSTKISDSSSFLKLKRNATSALGNIISDSKHHEILFRNSCEPKLSILITQLMCSTRGDPDPVIRRRAMRTIRCLATSMDIRVKKFISKGNLSSFLVEIILPKGKHESENDDDILAQACQTVIALKGSIEDEVWPQLQIALIQRIEKATCANTIPVAALCLTECFMKSSFNHNASFSIEFWNNLEELVSKSSEIHAAVTGLFDLITQLEKKRTSMLHQYLKNPSTLTKTPVINTLTTILLESKCNEEETKNQILHIILSLAENECNKKLLAGNDKLLSGLVALCLERPDSKIKNSAKNIILQLVPEI